jgi:hypothetical protein
MRITSIAISVLLLVVLAAGCVTSAPQGTAGGSSSSNPEVMKLNGRSVYADELIKTPFIRMAIRQYLTYDTLLGEISRRNLNVSEAEIDEMLRDRVDYMEEGGMLYEEFLQEQSLTDAEFRDSIKATLMFERLLDDVIVVTEEEMRKVWDEQQNQVLEDHIRDNSLPVSMRSTLTYEDCKETIRSGIHEEKKWDAQRDAANLLVNSTEMKITCIKDPKEAERYEDLILYSHKDKLREEGETLGGAEPEGTEPDAAEGEETMEAEDDASAGEETPDDTGDEPEPEGDETE